MAFVNVFQEVRAKIANYGEETKKIDSALVQPGQSSAQVKLGALTQHEVELLAWKMHTLVWARMNEAIATIIAEEFSNIIDLVRMVKMETKEAFGGLLAGGAQLQIMALRAKDIGSTKMNSADTAGKGLYGGTSGGIYTWEYPFTAGSNITMIPEQTMKEECGVIYLGFVDELPTPPKINACQWTLSGTAGPPESLEFEYRESTSDSQLAVARLEKPVLVGPEKKQKLDISPYITGNARLRPIALIVAKVDDLSL